jgi:hypothetical protein
VAPMNIFVLLIIIVALLAILGVLGVGIFQLFRGGDPRRANRLMRYRVILQFSLVMLMGLFALLFQR